MRHIFSSFTIIFSMFIALSAWGQPKNAKQVLLTLKTFKSGGAPVATSYCCKIAADGTMLGAWTPFNGADSAVVVDAAGKSHAVTKIYGANELYNIAKFQIDNASVVAAMQLAKTLPSASSKLWVLGGKPVEVTLSRSEKFNDKYNYYVLGDKMELKNDHDSYPDGSPVVNASGELVGVYYCGSSVLSATDWRYGNSLQPSEFAILDPTLRQTTIRKALPADLENAQLALMSMAKGRTSDYEAAAKDFISMFPKENDGYYDLAVIYVSQEKFADADKIMREAISKVTDKALAHYNFSRLMWQKTAIMPQTPFPAWTFDTAMSEVDAACKLSPEPVYDEMKGKIDYSKGNYDAAYERFMKLTTTSLRNPDLFFEAAQCRQQMGASDAEILSLLDSAVAVCDTPYTAVAAPYFLARGEQYGKMRRYRDAMIDLYRYEGLAGVRQPASFYYRREQFEFKGKLYQNALADINTALLLDTRNTLYWTEKANVHLRVNQLDNAIKSTDIAIQTDSAFATAYLIKGLAQCQSGNTNEGLPNLEKAKELGDAQADAFISRYRKKR